MDRTMRFEELCAHTYIYIHTHGHARIHTYIHRIATENHPLNSEESQAKWFCTNIYILQ